MSFLVFGQTGQVATELSRFEDVTCLGRADADLNRAIAARLDAQLEMWRDGKAPGEVLEFVSALAAGAHQARR